LELSGVITKSTGSWHFVKTEMHGIVPCKAAGKLRIKGIKATNPVTVGDQVFFDFKENENNGFITQIVPRENYIIRKSIKLSKQHHLIAANIDQSVLVVCTKMPETPLEFIDRFLLSAEAYFIPSILVFNKTDLLTKEDDKLFRKNVIHIYESIGYSCIEVSAKTGYQMDRLKELLENKRSLISGNSGVGKSSLINAIDENLDLKTGEISDVHETGKHITTYSEMYNLAFGGEIIDTPGIRGFGIIDIDKNEVGLYFKEIFHTSKNCKYTNCTHIHEPGCAVIEAAEAGKISFSRYKSYVNIFYDDNEKYR
jgi:ribosome biogenesis GTPase